MQVDNYRIFMRPSRGSPDPNSGKFFCLGCLIALLLLSVAGTSFGIFVLNAVSKINLSKTAKALTRPNYKVAGWAVVIIPTTRTRAKLSPATVFTVTATHQINLVTDVPSGETPDVAFTYLFTTQTPALVDIIEFSTTPSIPSTVTSLPPTVANTFATIMVVDAGPVKPLHIGNTSETTIIETPLPIYSVTPVPTVILVSETSTPLPIMQIIGANESVTIVPIATTEDLLPTATRACDQDDTKSLRVYDVDPCN